MEIKLLFFTLIGLFVLVLVLYLLREYKMEEKYSFLWLIMGIIVFLTPLLYPVWSIWAGKLGLADPNLLIVVLGMVGILLLCLQFTLALSKAYRDRKTLAQHITFLSLRIQLLEKKLSQKREGKLSTQSGISKIGE
ncbi:MAG TPA: DUF2304 domain-containing protein [archaeon]|nr:DUF2304 domain-containing protein [archaeon]